MCTCSYLHSTSYQNAVTESEQPEEEGIQICGLSEVTSEEELQECIFNRVAKDVVRHDLDFEVGYYKGYN